MVGDPELAALLKPPPHLTIWTLLARILEEVRLHYSNAPLLPSKTSRSFAILESHEDRCFVERETLVSASSMITKQGIFQGAKSLLKPRAEVSKNVAMELNNNSIYNGNMKQHPVVHYLEFVFSALKNARHATLVPNYSNAATQHGNSDAAPSCMCIEMMTEVLPRQGGDDSNLNHQAHAQVAGDDDDNDGPPPTRTNINNPPADETAAANWLFAMGCGTLIMSVATFFYKAPRGVVFERYKAAYYGTLAVISVCGMAEVAVAFCVSRCRRFLRVVLCASVVPFVTVVALGGFSVVIKG